MARSGKLQVLLGAIIIAGLITGGYLILQGASLDVGPVIGKRAPDFTLSTLEGQTISLKDLRGNLVILNFWATWCPACREEMPYLQAIHEEKGGQGVKLVAVDIGEPRSTVQQFMQQGGYTFTVVLDTNSKVSQDYKIWSIPATFFIDSEGILRSKKVGAFQSAEEIANILQGME